MTKYTSKDTLFFGYADPRLKKARYRSKIRDYLCEIDMKESQPTGVVSGSYSKFKREIDLAIEEFEDNGVRILGSVKGPLLVLPESPGFHPLQHELHLPIKVIEDSFLASISIADFHYLVNPHGYIGISVSMEWYWAMAKKKPIYLQHSPSPLFSDLDNIYNPEIILTLLKVRTPTEVAKMALERNFDITDYFWMED